MREKITLDDFLQQDNDGGFLCTIESIPDDLKKVRLTPWVNESEGCHCDAAFNIEKDLIDSVIMTGFTQLCCGKRHKVVEVLFKKNASVKIGDLIDFAVNSSFHKGHHTH